MALTGVLTSICLSIPCWAQHLGATVDFFFSRRDEESAYLKRFCGDGDSSAVPGCLHVPSPPTGAMCILEPGWPPGSAGALGSSGE